MRLCRIAWMHLRHHHRPAAGVENVQQITGHAVAEKTVARLALILLAQALERRDVYGIDMMASR